MNSLKVYTTLLRTAIVLFIFLSFTSLTAQVKGKSNSIKLSKTLTEQYAKFNINNISTFIYRDGRADNDPNTGNSGFQYPKSSGKTTMYESGFVWGAKIDGEIRVGGSTYSSGLNPGKILSVGSAEDINSPNVRVYRVRRDYKDADLQMEANDEGKTAQEIFSQYEKDWNEWPAESGAPFEDKNMNGKYEPLVDIPGTGDQTLWFVANDLNPDQTRKVFSSLPMGIEMQVTVWGYNQNYALGNMLFKKYVIINKSQKHFDEMYLGIWSDPDIGGDAGDDLIGCDTTMNLGYAYNKDDQDPSYGSFIPAVGFHLLQGPLVPGSSNDRGYFRNKMVTGKRNLPITALSLYIWPILGDPYWPDPRVPQYFYNFLQGKLYNGDPFQNPLTGGATKLPFSGDPIAHSGFLDFIPFPRISDRRMIVCTGPFNMAPGDTQEVVFAEIAAGGDQGYSRFASISLLKKSVAAAKQLYLVNFIPPATLKQISNLQAAEMDREIILTWGSDVAKINEVEKLQSTIYSFQGYNVYQISKEESTLGDKKLIATFDLKDNRQYYYDEEVEPTTGYVTQVNKKFGSDSGIQRFILIKKDYLNEIPLNNGSDYDFGVSYFRVSEEYYFPYGYVENPISIVTVKPQTPKPGIRLTSKFGDLINSIHTAGNSNAEVSALILDPIGLTGNEYEISFKTVNGKTVFNLTNTTSSKPLLVNQANLSGDNDFLVTEGFILRVKDNSSKPLSEKDVFRLTTPKATYDEKLAIDDLEKINVFPNPYYGGNRNEFNKYDRHVTFSHLPQRAVIRIFNIAGELVRKIEKDSPGQFLRWNILTENYFQVPSGLYIVHIELPDLGRIKILKLALFTEVFLPDRY